LFGAAHDADDPLVRRPVGGTGWYVEFQRDDLKPFLPGWAYPGFAALLVVFALAYGIQEFNRRRLQQDGDRRAGTVHALYDLASRALHAETIGEQVEQLAIAALDLADVDDVRVTVTSSDGMPVEFVSGAPDVAARTMYVPIEGPRGVLGELVVGRDDLPFDESEGWVLQTAAALVGAAIETLASLESERAVAAELQRLDELRSNLLATVAHELLSPLTAVKGVLGLLSMQDDLGERGREFVDVATERTDRLVELIRDLFDCSLLETGQLDIKPKRQRADELLDAALGAQAAARPGELRLSATENLMITVDPVRFDQLVNNLVTNAFRHGEAPVEVAVRPADGGAYVVVSDEGAGIAAADRDEIFGKFWQGSTGHARTSQGAGLGLSLVQGLVRVHGGDITIDSTHADGRGARFTAFFPDAVETRGQVPSDGHDETPSLVER
jgi:signal transduction histidine kinase